MDDLENNNEEDEDEDTNDQEGVSEDEEDEVWIHYSWGNNKLIHDGEEKTLDDIYDEVDMGDLGEWDEFMDSIQYVCFQTIFKKTGFIIHFDSQI